MREALAARSDRDFMIAEPAPRSRSASRGAKANPARNPIAKKALAKRSFLAIAISRPREIAAALFFVACAGAIAWNALALQKARHPAPLFAKGTPSAPVAAPGKPVDTHSPLATTQAPAAPAAPVEAAPSITVPAPPKPPQRNAIGDLIRNGGEVAPVVQAPARAAPAPNAVAALQKPTAPDPIAEIIRMGGPVPVPPASVGKVEADDTVLAGQRALAKIGYGVKVDGFYGPGTRQAIEAFERDKRLPVTGEFGPRTVRELASQAGIAIP